MPMLDRYSGKTAGSFKDCTECAVIVTAIREEYQAVCAHLQGVETLPPKNATVYEQGIFQSDHGQWRVILLEAGEGNPAAAIESALALEEFKPKVLMFVGVAGGLKDVQV